MIDNNVYVNVYFRVESGYDCGNMNKEKKQAFFKECKNILAELGFTIKDEAHSGHCPEGIRGVENLYCHPQSLSGYIVKEQISIIEDTLKCAKTFKCYATDCYDEALNYTEDEFKQALNECRPKLEQNILEACVTKRKNLFKVFGFYSMGGLSSGLKYFRHSKLEGIETSYILDLFEKMVTQGKLARAKTKSGIGYQTINHSNSQSISKSQKAITNPLEGQFSLY